MVPDSIVAEVKRRLSLGGPRGFQKQMAEELGISESMVSLIRRGNARVGPHRENRPDKGIRSRPGCREFHASNDKKGYGLRSMSVDGRRRQVPLHRWVWEMVNGPIPDGMFVLHRCDNPPCFLLAHLSIGTNADNVADRVAKGRSARLAGEANPSAKVDQAQVDEIRHRYTRGDITQLALAEEYGLTQTGISQIIRRVSWSG